MMTCYFDESGGADLGWTYVCGYVASVDQWERFEIDWKIFLAKYDIPYFHMKECAHFKGPFSKWKNNESSRNCFLRDASLIIRAYVRHSFVSLVSHDIFAEANMIYKFCEVFKTPYSLAGRACIEAAHEEIGSEIKYVFEDGCPDKGGLIHSMTACLPCRRLPSFEPSRNFISTNQWPNGRIGVIPLQAADFLAYESRKLLIDREKLKIDPSKFRKSLLALSRNVPLTLCLITPDVIDRICVESHIERRPYDTQS
jgi:hypothetical protein